MENYKDILKKKLKMYTANQIIFTDHARTQAMIRGIELEEVKNNILNPKRLVFAGKQEALRQGEEKYDCYFEYSGTQAHRYVLTINNDVIICTIIKINCRWQKKVEKYARI